MDFLSFSGVLFLLTLSQHLGGVSSQAISNPGYCSKASDCQANYQCISVNQTISGASNSAQCTPMQACAGVNIGYCPTFNNWPALYQGISPICAFTFPNNCKANSSDTTNGTVDCYTFSFSNGSTSKGIYSCINYDLFKSGNYGLDQTSAILNSCKSNGTTAGVCNQQGTCGPIAPGSLNYTCLCNAGFSSSDNCYAAKNNTCMSLGQCGQGGTCDLSTTPGTCVCKPGYMGLQCSQCDPTAASPCNGNGVCNNGICQCNPGSSPPFCGKGPTSTPSPTSDTASISLGHLSVIIAGSLFYFL